MGKDLWVDALCFSVLQRRQVIAERPMNIKAGFGAWELHLYTH